MERIKGQKPLLFPATGAQTAVRVAGIAALGAGIGALGGNVSSFAVNGKLGVAVDVVARVPLMNRPTLVGGAIGATAAGLAAAGVMIARDNTQDHQLLWGFSGIGAGLGVGLLMALKLPGAERVSAGALHSTLIGGVILGASLGMAGFTQPHVRSRSFDEVAEKYVKNYDVDKNGTVDLGTPHPEWGTVMAGVGSSAEHSYTGGPELGFGTTLAGSADSNGNFDGHADVDEVKANLAEQWDTNHNGKLDDDRSHGQSELSIIEGSQGHVRSLD